MYEVRIDLVVADAEARILAGARAEARDTVHDLSFKRQNMGLRVYVEESNSEFIIKGVGALLHILIKVHWTHLTTVP